MWTSALIIGEMDSITDLFSRHLTRAGFEVNHRTSALGGLEIALQKQPNLILLNCREGDFANMQLSRSLREELLGEDFSIVIIGEKDDAITRRFALEAGANDYIVDKGEEQDLLFRVDRILRGDPHCDSRVLRYADVEMDLERHRVRRRDVALSLTATQFNLLRHFMEHPHHVFTRTRLREEVWGANRDIDEKTVNAAIHRIRQELDSAGGPPLIRTVRGIGYSLDGGGNKDTLIYPSYFG